MKIAIIGKSGSGKSTLSKYYSDKYGLPILYMDTVFWLPNWKENTGENVNRIVNEFMDKNCSWVIDGNYFRFCFDRRLDEADKIIYMNFNRFSCLFRCIKRYYKYRYTNRDSLTVGCNEKIDWEFISWILFEGRSKKIKEKMNYIKNKYQDKLIEINNQKQLDKYYKEI